MGEPRIGLIGIGNMGWPMAKNIVKAGHALGVHDADRQRVERFVAEEPSARPANGAVGLAQSSDIVITMLPTGAIVREVVTGILEAKALTPGQIVVDMSSSEPAGTRALAATLKQAGVILIDAPVSGGVRGAVAGTLALMIGSDDDAAVERVRPVLESMGQKLFRTGGPGTGHAMKCLNNYLASTSLRATTEALSIGAEFGLDPKLMIDVINASTGRTTASEGLFPAQILTGKFALGFSIGLMSKDVGIAAGLANEVGVAAPGVALLHNALCHARETLGYNADMSNAYTVWTSEAKAKPR